MADKKNAPAKLKLTEMSRADHGIMLTRAFIDGMLENPDPVLQQQGGRLRVYTDLLRDDQVKSTFQQRRTAITNAEWYVDAATESPEDEEAAEWLRGELDRIGFDNITDKMLYAIHYGWSVAETLYTIAEGRVVIDKIKVRDRARFGFDVEGNLYLKTDNFKNKIMPPENFWVVSMGASHDDNPYGEGLAHSLYWPVFFKRNGIKFWMIHLEKFSMPTAVAKLNNAQYQDEEKRGQALEIIDAIQADSGVVIPEDFVIELLEATRSGSVDYEGLKGAMDAAIAKIVLSQTMTTDNGSSRSQAEVHQGVKEELIKSDADLVCASFNDQVVKRLIAWNFPNAKPPKVWRRTEPEINLLEVAKRDAEITKLGYEPTEEYIKETYGEGWRKKEAVLPPTANGLPEMNADFAEVTALTQKRIAHRQDQQALVDAAEYMATKYKDLYGKRIEQLLSFMEETDDVDTFKKHLNELMAEPASEQAAETIRNATLVSRLMGMFKGSK